jgi:hypothetical protein
MSDTLKTEKLIGGDPIPSSLATSLALWDVVQTARKVGDDESDTGLRITGLEEQANKAHGQLMMHMRDVERAFETREYDEWVRELSEIPFLEWLAQRGEAP